MDVGSAHGGAPILVACLSPVSDNTRKFTFMFLSASSLTSIGKAIGRGGPGANWPIVGLPPVSLLSQSPTSRWREGAPKSRWCQQLIRGRFACRG
jgi:hypothetical protein